MKLFELFATISLKTDDFNKSISSAKSSFGALGDKADKIIGGLVTGITTASTALFGLGAASVSIGKDFEQAMANIAAVTGGTSEEVQMMGEASREMAIDFGLSATDIARAFQFIAEAGGDAEEMIDDMRGALSLAAASGEDFKMATEFMAASMKLFGDEAVNSEHIANVLSATISAANTTVGELDYAFQQVGPTASMIGASIDDVSIALALMAENGITGGKAGTSLNRMLLDMISPTDKSAIAMGKLGLSVLDANNEFKPLSQIMDDVRSAFGDMDEAQKAEYTTTIFNTASLSALNAVLSTTDEDLEWLTETIYDSQQAFDGMGQAAGMSEKQLDTLQGEFNRLKSEAQDMGISFYQSIQEPLKEVVGDARGYMKELSDAFSEGGLSAAVASIGGIAADIVAQIAEQAPMFIQTGIDLISSLAQGITENKEIIVEGIRDAMNALFSGIRELIPQLVPLARDALALFAEGFIQYKELYYTVAIELLSALAVGIADNIDILVSQAKDSVFNIVNTIADNLPLIVQAAVDIVLALASGIAEMLPEIIDSAIQIVVGLVEGLIDAIPMLIDAALQLVIGLAQGLLKAIPVLIAAIPNIISSLITVLLDSIPLIIQAGIDLLVSIVEALPDIIQSIVEAIPQIITGIITALLDSIPLIIQAGIDLLIALVRALPQIIVTIVSAIPQIITGVVDALISAIPQIIMAGIQLLVSLIGNLPTIIMEIVKAVPQIISGLVLAIVQSIPKLITAGWELFSSLIAKLPEIKDYLFDAVPQIMRGIVESFKSFVPEMISMGLNLISGLKDGIIGAGGAVVDAAKGVGKKMLNGIKDFFGINSPSKEFAGVGRDTMEGLVIGVTDTSKKVLTAVSNTAKDAAATASTAFSGMEGIGRNAAEGLAKGIEKETKKVTSAAEKMARAAELAAKGTLQIKSPSHVFDKLGSFTGQGFIGGLKKMGRAIASTVESVFDFSEMDAPSISIPSVHAQPLSQSPAPFQFAAPAREAESFSIHIENMTVRDDTDIDRIARELYLLQERRQRGGVVYA